jgi:hypothetical protein
MRGALLSETVVGGSPPQDYRPHCSSPLTTHLLAGVCALNMEAMGAFQGEQSEAPEGPRPRAPPARATVPRPAAPQPHPRSDYETHVTAERAPPPSAAPHASSRGVSGERGSGGAQQPKPAARAADAVPGSQRPPRARPAAGKEAGVRSVKLQGTPVVSNGDCDGRQVCVPDTAFVLMLIQPISTTSLNSSFNGTRPPSKLCLEPQVQGGSAIIWYYS